jgi:hypothetical protein
MRAIAILAGAVVTRMPPGPTPWTRMTGPSEGDMWLSTEARSGRMSPFADP